MHEITISQSFLVTVKKYDVSILCVCVLRSVLPPIIHKVSSVPEIYRHLPSCRLNLEMCRAILPLPYMTCILTLLYRLMILFSQLKNYFYVCNYRAADKSLARPGSKQATATEDFEFHISYL